MTGLSWPGENLCIKIVETLSKGAGTLTKPWQIRREAVAHADAERLRRLGEERARQEIELIRADKVTLSPSFKLIPLDRESQIDEVDEIASEYLQVLQQRGTSPSELLALEHQINLEQISRKAFEEAAEENNSDCDPEPINKDWFSQWRNRAQDVSDEDMQRLWARALKGEAQKKGPFSLHTLDFLSRMSREDAEKLACLGQFVCDGDIDCKGPNDLFPSMTAAGLSFADLLKFEVLGILTGVSTGLGLGKNKNSIQLNGQDSITLRCKNYLLAFHPKDPKNAPARFDCHVVSFLGQEILKLAHTSANIDYLKEIADTKRELFHPKIAAIVEDLPNGHIRFLPLNDF